MILTILGTHRVSIRGKTNGSTGRPKPKLSSRCYATPLQYDKRDKHLAAYMQQRQRAIDALIKRGRFFTPVKRPKGFRLGRLKACCCNAARIAIGNGIDGRGQYVEGYAMSSGSGFIAKHAWLTTDGSNAIDVTWRDPALADFGIVYDTKVLARTIMG